MKKIIIALILLITIFTIASGFYLFRNEVEPITSKDKIQSPTGVNTLTLNFESGAIILNKSGSGKTENTFWNLPINIIDGIQNELPEEELVKNLYQETDVSLYYLGGDRDTFYELFPGFYRKLFLTKEIPEETSNTNENNEEYKQSRICTSTKYEDFSALRGSIAQNCVTSTENFETGGIVESSITNCYLPQKNNTYLSYVQIGNILDGDYNLCRELENIGIQI